MKKQVKRLNQVYGEYLSLDFVSQLGHVAKEAQIRARYNLADLVKQDTSDDAINICVEAEHFWKLIEKECREWLDEAKRIKYEVRD